MDTLAKILTWVLRGLIVALISAEALGAFVAKFDWLVLPSAVSGLILLLALWLLQPVRTDVV